MTKEGDIATTIETAKEKLGGVDILVNNAGTMYSGRFAAFDDDEMKKQIDTKLFGFMRTIRAVYPMMKVAGGGGFAFDMHDGEDDRDAEFQR